MLRTPLILAFIVGITACVIHGAGDRQIQEYNKAVVRGYMEELLNEEAWDSWDRYFPERVVFNETEITKDSLIGASQFLRNAFPDLRVTIEDQIAERDRVVTRVVFCGTHRGEFRGIPATGKTVRYSGIAIDRIVNGKVVQMWHEADVSQMIEQITEKRPAGV